MSNELILHKIGNESFYVDEDMNVIDMDGHFIYCFIHYDIRLYLNHDGFICCSKCNMETKLNGFE